MNSNKYSTVFISLIYKILITKQICKDNINIIINIFLGYHKFIYIIDTVVSSLKFEQSVMSTMISFADHSRYVYYSRGVKLIENCTNLMVVFNKLKDIKICKLQYPKLHECVKFLIDSYIPDFTTSYNIKRDGIPGIWINKCNNCQKNLEWCDNLTKILSSMFKTNGIITLPPYIRSRSMMKIIEAILNEYFGFSVIYISTSRRYSTVYMLSEEFKGKNLKFDINQIHSLNVIKSLINSNRTCKM